MEEHGDEVVERLRKAVAIASISLDFAYRNQCIAMSGWLVEFIERCGGSARKIDIGYQETGDGTKDELPPSKHLKSILLSS